MALPRTFNVDRARRALDVINALVAEGCPFPSWFAVRLEDGKTHGAAYPTKGIAMAHTHNPNHFAFLVVQHPLDVPSVAELVSYLRFVEMRENYWIRNDPDAHLHMPKHGVPTSGDATAFGGTSG